MGESTAIGWTDHTFNPWWGCTRVSPGCQHCYAETFAKRYGHDVWGRDTARRFFSDKHWAEPLAWNTRAVAAGVRRRVFCASMADVFEDRDDLASERSKLWELIAATPSLDWQLLTKRPENVARLVPYAWSVEGFPRNVWVGASVEDQQRADERIPYLVGIPAAVRFLSCEPLLGPIDLTPWLFMTRDRINWLIAGGESGPGHRPLNVDHARQLRAQCEAGRIPFFFKQVGGHTSHAGGDLLDGIAHKNFPTSSPTCPQAEADTVAW